MATSPGGFSLGGYGPQEQHPAPYSPGGGQTISPGAITYTTSTGPDGKVIYHPFRAVPASYQTPNGKVTGIQWVPAEATQMLPSGAQPANAEFAASWNRGHLTRDDEKALKHWQRDEEKRRRKEEKQSAKRLAQYDRERRERDREDEFRGMRGDGYNPGARERRKSFNATAPGGGIYAAGYGASDLTNRFGDMGIDGRSEVGSAYAPTPGRPRKYSVTEQDKRRSAYGGATSPYAATSGGAYPESSAYPTASAYPASNSYNTATSPYSPNMRSTEPPFAGGAVGASGYPTSAYSSAASNAGEPFPRSTSPYPRAASPYARAASPYARAASPYARAPSPYAPGGPGAAGGAAYPRGHILEGQPMSRSRAPSPVGGGPGYPSAAPAFPQPGIPQPSVGYAATGGPSPNMGGMASLAGAGGYPGQQQEQLAAPAGFSRPINAAQPYTPFDMMKIQDMDDLLGHIPKMPLVLQPHDVYHEDWIRLMEDLALAWAEKLPIPEFARGGRPPKRSTLAADLVDLWNSSFFLARGCEVVLYKGRERRSGPNAGTIDRQLPAYNTDDSYSDASSTDSSDSDSSSSDEDGPRAGYGGEYGVYGRQPGGQMADYSDARRRQREKKKEKKRRHKEKKARKKARARENRYSLYLTYVPRGGMVGAGGMGRVSPAMGPGMGPGMGGMGMGPMPGGLGISM